MDLQSAPALLELALAKPSFQGMCGFVQQGFAPGDGTPELLLHVVFVVSDVSLRHKKITAPRLW